MPLWFKSLRREIAGFEGRISLKNPDNAPVQADPLEAALQVL